MIEGPSGSVRFIVGHEIGAGGFGRVYLAEAAGRGARSLPKRLCVKITSDLRSWICEAYFGFLLTEELRAIHLYDAVPLACPDGALPGLFALVFEYAQHGPLTDYLKQRRRGWSGLHVRREMIALLKVLDVLHQGRALHRDLTPFNVFVCEGEHLKLGDFGIARHHVRDAVPARTLNRGFAPREMLRGAVRHWRARDDVYQVGQLLGILVKGDASAPLTAGDVRRLGCGDHMKEIIQRCIGTAHKRFQTAGDLMAALAAAPVRLDRASPRISSLRGHVLVFTGKLAVRRPEAARLARRAGATVDNRVTERTTVVVRGTRAPCSALALWAAS